MLAITWVNACAALLDPRFLPDDRHTDAQHMGKTSGNATAARCLTRAKLTIDNALTHCGGSERAALARALDDIETASFEASQGRYADGAAADALCAEALRLIARAHDAASVSRGYKAQLAVAARHLAAARAAFGGSKARRGWLRWLT
jgi:hypothetical protein